MSNIEDVLRSFRPAPEPEGFWDRVVEGRIPNRKTGLGRRRSWVVALAAAALFAFVLSIVSKPFRGSAPVPPQRALQKIREALEHSETACIKFTLEPDPAPSAAAPGALPRKTGVVFLKQGNKLNLSVKEWASRDTRGVPEAEARVISDGTRMERCLLRHGIEVSAEEMGAKSIAPGLTEWFLHAGTLSSWPAVVDLGAREPIRDLKANPPMPGAHVLSYTVGAVSVTLWYDSASYKVLRRILRSEAIGTATETFQEYEFNEDMPDSLFVLAKEK
jgi:hypothetical protein